MKLTIVCLLIMMLVLTGCSTISQNEIFESLKKDTGQALQWIKTPQEAQSVNGSVNDLLSSPLTQDNAVRIALINNRSLQETYEQIGISQSDLVQAGLISNPLLGYSIGKGNGKITSTFSLDIAFLDLLWIPLKRELGGIALEETKYHIGDEVLRVTRDTRKAYVDARVAHEQVALYGNLLKSHEASLQLAIRQHAAGNLSKRDFLKVQDIYANARLEAIHLNRESAVAREALNRLLGLYAQQTHYMLDQEPLEIKPVLLSESGLENMAITHRLDMAAAIKGVDYAAYEAGYTNTTRLLNEIEISAQSERTTNENRFNTFGLKIPIPIFDFGQGRLGKTQAMYNQSIHHLHAMAVNIRSEVRESYARYRYSYDIAQEYDEVIVKTNQQILEETQLFYNGMLDGVYKLLEDQRQVAHVKMQGQQAIGEYQKAQVDLEYTIGRKL